MSVEILNPDVDQQGYGYVFGRITWVLILIFAPLMVWLSTLGNPVNYWHYDLPPGQLLYVISKLLGLYAITLLWLQAMYGLLRHEQWARFFFPAWSIQRHRSIGLLVLFSVLLHASVFFVAASIRKNEIMLHLLVPDFTNGFYSAVVSLGLVALVMMLIGVAAGLLRHKIGKGWLWVHRLLLIMLVLVFLHSILIGSETRTLAWLLFYILQGVTLCIAISLRLRVKARAQQTATFNHD